MHPVVKEVIKNRLDQLQKKAPIKDSEPIVFVQRETGRLIVKKFNDFGKHLRP